jgi:hypothetical protein
MRQIRPFQVAELSSFVYLIFNFFNRELDNGRALTLQLPIPLAKRLQIPISAAAEGSSRSLQTVEFKIPSSEVKTLAKSFVSYTYQWVSQALRDDQSIAMVCFVGGSSLPQYFRSTMAKKLIVPVACSFPSVELCACLGSLLAVTTFTGDRLMIEEVIKRLPIASGTGWKCFRYLTRALRLLLLILLLQTPIDAIIWRLMETLELLFSYA